MGSGHDRGLVHLLPLMRRVLTILLTLAGLAGPALAAAPSKQIAITIDDLPVASVTDATLADVQAINGALLTALKAHGVKAVGFVNEDRLFHWGEVDARIATLAQWLDAGMELGNHNHGHLGLWKHSVDENADAVIKGEAVLRRLTSERGAPLRYYRHPYTQTGRTVEDKQAFEGFLAARGYRIAPFTIEHDDYLFACLYDRTFHTASAAALATLENDYVAHLKQAVGTYESMSQQLFGRQIPQILLVHANRLNARMLDRLLATLRELGYGFIPLEQALRDEAYRSPDLPSGQFGPSWLTRWAKQRGAKLSVYGHADPDGETARQAARLCGG
jgi:peptidoglycan/xylan/chitin deacetylase (PgdA/CDA1 family)